MTAIVFLFISISLIIRNFILRNTPFMDWDEGIYAQVAREILRSGNIITTFNGTLWLNKPPLVHGIIAAVFGIFGENEFAARMIMVTAAITLLILTFLLTKKIYQELFPVYLKKYTTPERTVLLLSPVFVLASAPVFVERSTILNTDVFLGIGWVGYFLYRRSFPLKLFFLCIGVLSKSLLGIYPLLLEVFLIRKKDFTKMNFLKSGTLVLIPFSWHIFSLYKYGNYFLRAHVADQVLKRVTAPIELHFGNFYFYPLLLWRNVDGVAFFMSVGYLYVFIMLFTLFKNGKLLTVNKDKLWIYITLLSPLPFFVFLTFMKSKISWYMVSVLPLFCIVIPYCFMVIKDTLLRRTALVFITAFFIIPFLAQTVLLKPSPGISPDTALAQCIQRTPQKSIAVAVDREERDVRNVLEAARLYTETSFLYGGSPSFVFYADKAVRFFYSLAEFEKQFDKSEMYMITDEDLATNPSLEKKLSSFTKNDCSTGKWSIYTE